MVEQKTSTCPKPYLGKVADRGFNLEITFFFIFKNIVNDSNNNGFCDRIIAFYLETCLHLGAEIYSY